VRFYHDANAIIYTVEASADFQADVLDWLVAWRASPALARQRRRNISRSKA
jgi:hypothetical protein